MATYLNLRIAEDVGERVKAHAKLLDRTPNRFAEMAIAAICDMIEREDARTLPEMVAAADLARHHHKSAKPLPSKVTSYTYPPTREESLRVAEEPPPEPKRRRG